MRLKTTPPLLHTALLLTFLAALLLGCRLADFPSQTLKAWLATTTPSPTPTFTPSPTPPPTATPSPTLTPTPTRTPTPTLTPTPDLTRMCEVEDSHRTITVQLPCLWKDVAESYRHGYQKDDYRYAGMSFLEVAPNLRAFEHAQAPGIIIGASKDAAKWYGYQQLLSMTLSWLPSGYKGYTLYTYGEPEHKYQDRRFRGGYTWNYFTKPLELSPSGEVWAYVLRPNTPDFVPAYMVGILMTKPNDIPDDTWQIIMKTALKTLTVHPRYLP